MRANIQEIHVLFTWDRDDFNRIVMCCILFQGNLFISFWPQGGAIHENGTPCILIGPRPVSYNDKLAFKL